MDLTDEKKLALSYLLLSSSSSESDDEEYVSIQWEQKSLPKINGFLSVIEEFDEKQFQKYFRMTKATTEKVIKMFQDSSNFPKNQGHGGRPQISAATHIYSFLWFAGNKCSIQDVAQRFNITESSLFRITHRVTEFLMKLGPTVIKMPKTDAEKEKLAFDFKQVSGFPGVLGCIDGTSINIRSPMGKIKSTYVNRHDIPSLTLQAVCDNKRRFLDVFTGVPGKVHDARVFKMSDLSQQLPHICGSKYHLLGDGAYAIREWLLTPYKDYGNLTREDLNFNRKFSSTRVLIENAFGLLKGRFRQLLRLDKRDVLSMSKFIISCCILHNICIDCEDFIEDFELDSSDEDPSQETHSESEWQLRRAGETKRNRIKHILPYT